MSRKNRGSAARANKRKRATKRKRKSAAKGTAPGVGTQGVRRSLLTGTSPAAILGRIVDGDPLGLEPRCRKYLREWAVLIDLERLFARTAARIAYHAYRENGTAGDEIVEDCLANAVEELLTQDRDGEDYGFASEDSEDRARFLAETLGIQFTDARGACVAFNDLSPEIRRCYWENVVEGRSIERCVSMGLGSTEAVTANVRHALETLSGYKGPDPGVTP